MKPIDEELHNAVEEGDLKKVVKLLKNGADPNSCHTNGYTVLMHAVRAWKPTSEQRVNIAQILLQNGADPSFISRDNYQALTLAHDMDIVIALLDTGVMLSPRIATNLMYNFYGNKQLRGILENKGIETDWTDSVRQIYNRINEYVGQSLYNEILEESIPCLQNSLFKLDRYKNYNVNLPMDIDDEYTFYAINRINELLLLSFQNKSSDNTLPIISLGQYCEFWEKVGLTVCDPKEFHPFFCEIYKVGECMDQPIPKLINSRWPCLMFGELLFSRASVRVLANSDCIHKQTAEESTLYWSHRRKDRKCEDLSQGWGSNSQWRTRFRFDYWSKEDLFYNVNHLNDSLEDDELSEEQRLELLKYRCFVKTPEVLDCYPYNYFTSEKYKMRD